MKDYLVYKHTNKTNGKVYIGITGCDNPEDRWRKGSGYQKNKPFWNAIQKYGWDGFEHEILITGLTEDEAKAAEIELIAKYKSNCARYKDPSFGYNLTDGGDTLADCLKKPILQYDLDGNLIKEWDSTKTASIECNINASTISYNLNGKVKRAGKFMWKLKEDEIQTKIEDYWTQTGFKNPNAPKAERKVCQYDLEGNLIRVWKSNQDAADLLHIANSGISTVINGKKPSYAGFVWRATEGEPEEKIVAVSSKSTKAVNQYDKNDNFIQSWESISDAGRALNINKSHITAVCKNKRRSAGGYVWKYKFQEEK